MKNKKLYTTLSLLTLVLLFLPMFQQCTGLLNLKPLVGVECEAQLTPFSFKNFNNYSYQHGFENYSSQHLGFREFFIRIYNQVMWSLYKTTQNEKLRISDDSWIYEVLYIDDYYGKRLIDYYSSVDLARQIIEKKINKLKVISEELGKHNTKLIFVILPDKARTYPEHIPDSMKIDIKCAVTDAKLYSEYLSGTNISYIDMASWFENMKANSPYLLFPQTGIHWSTYGSTIAADSLFKFMEMSKGIDMPNMRIDSLYKTTNFKTVDTDMENLLNIIFPINKAPIYYPQISFESAEGKIKPEIIVIADSFWWNIYDMDLNKVFSRMQYYYYYRSIYSPTAETTNVDQTDVFEGVKQTDFVLLMASTAQLCGVGWGFIDEMYNKVVAAEDPIIRLNKIEAKKKEILGNKEWLDKLKKKAQSGNITLDSIIKADAEWIVNMGL